jgi:hypothetical protein
MSMETLSWNYKSLTVQLYFRLNSHNPRVELYQSFPQNVSHLTSFLSVLIGVTQTIILPWYCLSRFHSFSLKSSHTQNRHRPHWSSTCCSLLALPCQVSSATRHDSPSSIIPPQLSTATFKFPTPSKQGVLPVLAFVSIVPFAWDLSTPSKCPPLEPKLSFLHFSFISSLPPDWILYTLRRKSLPVGLLSRGLF